MKKRVWVSLFLSVALLLALALAVGARLPSGYEQTRGLYVFFDTPGGGYDPPALPIKGGFWRYNWSALETGNGVYNWIGLDNWIQQEQQNGKLAAIAFSFYNEYDGGSDRGLQMPAWVWQTYPDVRMRNTRRADTWYLANFLSSNLRTRYSVFINAFAQHLAANPSLAANVAWISMGVGLSGETQPSTQWKDSEKPDWEYYRYDQQMTSDQWISWVNFCSDTYKQAFASRGLNTPIFLDIGPTYRGGPGERETFASYARSVGVGIRNNGLQVDRVDAPTIYAQMASSTYYNNVPTTWESYSAPGWLDSKGALLWGALCGLAKHPDSFTFDKTIFGTAEYLSILQFTANYCGVTAYTSPGAWTALRQTKSGGETGNWNFYMTQKDSATGGLTTAVWDVGADRRYRFDGIASGNCTLELHFAEIYPGYGAGARIFDIVVEGQTVEDNFDPVVAAGGASRAVIRSYTVPVLDGQLEFTLSPDWAAGSDDYPALAAIKLSGPGGYLRRVNCGGGEYTDHGNNVWSPDQEYVQGSWGYIAGPAYRNAVDILNSNDDPLYQAVRKFEGGAQSWGRFARRTDQASSNTRMYFDIDSAFLSTGFNGSAVITVTYYTNGTDRFKLRYDSTSGTDKAAVPYGSSNDYVQKDGKKLWEQAVFHLTDARFLNGQTGATDFSIDCTGDGDEYVSFVEVSKGTGGPVGATLQGHVTLQRPGTAPPHSTWQTALTVRVGGDYNVTTDSSGYFTLANLTPGTYNIRVKSGHSLANVKNGVVLNAGSNSVDLGTLLEGDANNDNCVDIQDFSTLKNVFSPAYGAGADFNQDGVVNIQDFSMLAANFNQCGDITMASPPQGSGLQSATLPGVQVSITPQATEASTGDIFTVLVQVEAGSQPVDGAEIHLDYDPSRLQVVDAGGNPVDHVDSSGTLDVVLRNHVDNAAGQIDFAAGTFSATPPSGTFALATIRLKAVNLAGSPATELHFVRESPRKTNVVYAGFSVLGGTSDGVVALRMSNKVYLPRVSRP